MLVELDIVNFAIIETMRVGFGRGLNVLTGETGAGKSILIDAVNAMLGGRCGPEVVRAGAELARVEGIFTLPPTTYLPDGAGEALGTILEQLAVAPDDNLILSREIHRNGRTVARLNGRMVPVGLLHQMGAFLVDIHGQGDHLSLLHSSQHINLLDHFAGLTHERQKFSAAVGEWQEVRKTLRELENGERELERRNDLLRYQADEIGRARLRVGEEDELVAERNLLANTGQRLEAATLAYQALKDSSEVSVLDLLGEVARHAAQLARLDATVEDKLRGLQESTYVLEDAASFLRSYADGVESDPTRLQAIEDRLELIRRLKKKYGDSISEVLSFAEQACAELALSSGIEQQKAALKEHAAGLEIDLARQARSLSDTRRAAGRRLALAVERELRDLNMDKTVLEVSCVQEKNTEGILVDGETLKFDRSGIDRIEFLVSANQGEPVRPLAKVASGGESARLMLALKSILAASDAIPTLIFDEIDMGIGGRSGWIVGTKLWHLAAQHQVLCVTHLPQIACQADDHFQIAKSVVDGRTTAGILRIDDDERVSELAAMLGGTASESARRNASELLANASEYQRAGRLAVPVGG